MCYMFLNLLYSSLTLSFPGESAPPPFSLPLTPQTLKYLDTSFAELRWVGIRNIQLTSDSTCKLCGSTSAETAPHFTAQCPALSSVRNSLSPRSLIPLLASDSQLFVDYVLGTMWVDDPLFQQEVIVLLHHLYTARLDQLSAAASSLPTQ